MTAFALAACLLAPEPPALSPKAALAEFNDLIGEWRGVGQPKRGSSRGAWRETADWVWDLDGEPAVTLDITGPEEDGGGMLTDARITFDPVTRRYRLAATLPGGDAVTAEAAQVGPTTVFVSDDPPLRVTLRRLNAKRVTLLLERPRAGGTSLRRVAEVGYTRAGERLAERGVGGPECVVTGGLGTVRVSYRGTIYWVCCSGCLSAFRDDPEGVLADWRERKGSE